MNRWQAILGILSACAKRARSPDEQETTIVRDSYVQQTLQQMRTKMEVRGLLLQGAP